MSEWCVCVYVSGVCVCVLDRERNMVFASSTLAVLSVAGSQCM